LIDIRQFIGKIQQSWTIEESHHLSVVELKFVFDDVGSRSRNVRHNRSKLSDKTVEEGGFSDIGRSDESDFHIFCSKK
jgi:hypothetical protein